MKEKIAIITVLASMALANNYQAQTKELVKTLKENAPTEYVLFEEAKFDSGINDAKNTLTKYTSYKEYKTGEVLWVSNAYTIILGYRVANRVDATQLKHLYETEDTTSSNNLRLTTNSYFDKENTPSQNHFNKLLQLSADSSNEALAKHLENYVRYKVPNIKETINPNKHIDKLKQKAKEKGKKSYSRKLYENINNNYYEANINLADFKDYDSLNVKVSLFIEGIKTDYGQTSIDICAEYNKIMTDTDTTLRATFKYSGDNQEYFAVDYLPTQDRTFFEDIPIFFAGIDDKVQTLANDIESALIKDIKKDNVDNTKQLLKNTLSRYYFIFKAAGVTEKVSKNIGGLTTEIYKENAQFNK